ncbi:MAG: hypothetical protein EOL88_09795, partial [Bacteroidia bacterium]|nr:hypothetical protein [Bacteroidia bacterium]
MNINDRINRIGEFCYNPYVDLPNKTNFENLYINSMRDFGREISMLDYCDFKNIKQKVVDVNDLAGLGKKHFVLWTGGKESYLTRKILDFYGVDYKTITFVESESCGIDFSGGTRKFIEEKHLTPDIIKQSTCVADLATNSWGSSVPILYKYILEIIKDYPGCVLWIGSEYTSCLARYKVKFALDQSDLLFSELNDDEDIFGSVYSIVNCLREFDIYRIVRKEFSYDPKYS